MDYYLQIENNNTNKVFLLNKKMETLGTVKNIHLFLDDDEIQNLKDRIILELKLEKLYEIFLRDLITLK